MQPGTALSEFYRLSIAAMAGPPIASGVMTVAEEARLGARLDEPDFLGCGFAFIGAWDAPRLSRGKRERSKPSGPGAASSDEMHCLGLGAGRALAGVGRRVADGADDGDHAEQRGERDDQGDEVRCGEVAQGVEGPGEADD